MEAMSGEPSITVIASLKGIRAVIDSRIEHLSNTGQRGTKIAVSSPSDNL
jgi:hypothetical protein